MTLLTLVTASILSAGLLQLPGARPASATAAIDTRIEALRVAPAALSPAQIDAALAQGHAHPKARHGLTLIDKANVMALGITSRGFAVRVFTPIAWIRQLAADAAAKRMTLQAKDLRREDVLPVLRVVVYPDTPTFADAGFIGASSVRTMILEDGRRQTQRTAVETRPFDLPLRHARTNALLGTYQGLEAAFTLDDVRALRASGDGEFFLTITGTTGEVKPFKIKKKHFDELPE